MRTSHTLGRHHPRKRMIQYSEAPMIEPKSCGILDTPLSPSMTARCEARCLKVESPN
jgi:hypothetical protein